MNATFYNFDAVTSTQTKGPKGEKKVYGGQEVAVKLESVGYKEYVARCREALMHTDLEALYHAALQADLAPGLMDDAVAALMASFDKSLANETPDPNYETVGVGLRRYVGKGRGNRDALYVSGVLVDCQVVSQGFGEAPAPKSRALTLAKNLVKDHCGMGQWVQFMLKGDEQDALKIEE